MKFGKMNASELKEALTRPELVIRIDPNELQVFLNGKGLPKNIYYNKKIGLIITKKYAKNNKSAVDNINLKEEMKTSRITKSKSLKSNAEFEKREVDKMYR